MKFSNYFFSFFLIVQLGCTQAPAERPQLINSSFDQVLSTILDFSIPTISVEELKARQSTVLLFDTRERNEYEVSHIEGARYLGYEDFQLSHLNAISKDTEIVLYCSIGYRSEKIGEKLKELGFSNVYNLYGSIFEWVNQGNLVVDQAGHVTKQVHGYDSFWARWLDADKVEKVF